MTQTEPGMKPRHFVEFKVRIPISDPREKYVLSAFHALLQRLQVKRSWQVLWESRMVHTDGPA